MVCERMMKCFSIGIMCIGWKFWKALSFKIWRKISINKYVINIYMNRECPQTPEICTKTLHFKGRICLNSWTHRLHTESVISFLIDGFTFIHSHQLDHHRMGNLGPHLGGLSVLLSLSTLGSSGPVCAFIYVGPPRPRLFESLNTEIIFHADKRFCQHYTNIWPSEFGKKKHSL